MAKNYYFASGKKATGNVERTAQGNTVGGKRVFNVPARYLSGLSASDKTARAKEIIRGRTTGRRSSTSPGDTDSRGKRIKTPESEYTKRFRKRFG